MSDDTLIQSVRSEHCGNRQSTLVALSCLARSSTDLRGAESQQARGEEGRFTPLLALGLLNPAGRKPTFLTSGFLRLHFYMYVFGRSNSANFNPNILLLSPV